MPPSPDLDDLASSSSASSSVKGADSDVVVPESSAHDAVAAASAQSTHKAYFVSAENPSRLLPTYARLY
jgi:hypothetical protein